MSGAWEYELPGFRTRPTSVEEAEALYRAALTSLGEGVLIQNADSTIVAANEAAPRILGLTMDQLLGRRSLDPTWTVIHRDGSPFPGESHPVPVALREKHSVRDVVMGVQRPDGTLSWIMVNVELIIGADGVDTGSVVCSYTDITAQTEADERYRLLAENSTDVVILLGVDNEVQWVSPSVATVLGWVPDDVTGRPMVELIHPDDLSRVQAAQQAAVGGGDDRGQIELRFATAAGGWRWMSASGRLLRNRTGDVIGDLSSLRDIEAEVAARSAVGAARAEVDEAYRLLADNSTGVVFRADNHGVFTWMSESVTDFLGWEPGDILGRDVVSLLHPDDVPATRAIQAGIMRGQGGTMRVRFRRVDGDYRWVEARVSPVLDAAGEVVSRVGSWRDIDAEVQAVDALRASERHFRVIAENATDVVFMADLDGIVRWISPSVTDTLGWDVDEVVGQGGSDFVDAVDRAAAPTARSAVIETHHPESRVLRYRLKGGGTRTMAVSLRPQYDDAGNVVGTVGGMRDVEEETAARIAMADSESMLRNALRAAAIGMALADSHGAFTLVNPALAAMLGRDESWLLAHEVNDVIDPQHRTLVDGVRDSLIHGETTKFEGQLRLLRADGEPLWARVAAVVIGDESHIFMIQIVDVTAEREAQEQLSYQAFHDALTGLRNRAWILDMLDVDLRSARRTGSHVGVFFIDLDNFKLVNDSLGHGAGDEVLAAVARRISSVMRPTDRVGRFGGDEFVVVVPEVQGAPDIERVAERISTAISAELMVEGHRIVPTASMGIAVSTPTSTPADLLRDTDSALFRAKDAGRARWHFFDEGMHAQAVARLTLEDELRRAIAHGEFVVHYQPIVRLKDSAVVGHEALVRWQHPERGLLYPGDFLEVAEDSGLIVAIGHQTLDAVCRLLAAHRDLPGPVNVNFSGVELSARDWQATFVETVLRHGVDPRRLVVEVTETAVLSLVDTTHRDLASLRELGVGIQVDDFGTGFSSISLLRDLPVTGIKLDATFVRDLTDGDSPANALAAGVAGLAQGLLLVGIAEGIETADQARTLLSQGWTHGQGYLFGRPEPVPLRDVAVRIGM
jgi:diguanylate cyclase (GGDEF)-like protein/PAS domain S-box-containing protein